MILTLVYQYTLPAITMLLNGKHQFIIGHLLIGLAQHHVLSYI